MTNMNQNKDIIRYRGPSVDNFCACGTMNIGQAFQVSQHM